MRKGRFLSERERDAIAAQYRRDNLYDLMRQIAPEAEELTRDYQHALSPEDLFYLVAEVLDLCFEQDDPHDSFAISEAEGEWLRVKQKLRLDSNMNDDELVAAATLVVITARECLKNADLWRYRDLITGLANGVLSHDSEGGLRLMPLVSQQCQTDSNLTRYTSWHKQYILADTWLSDDLESLLLEVRKSEPNQTPIEYEDEIIQELLPFFRGDAALAGDFLHAIYNKPNEVVILEINQRIRNRQLLIDRKAKKLHQILTSRKFNLYHASYANFSKQLAL